MEESVCKNGWKSMGEYHNQKHFISDPLEIQLVKIL